MALSTCFKRRPHKGDINDTSQQYWQPEQGPPYALCLLNVPMQRVLLRASHCVAFTPSFQRRLQLVSRTTAGARRAWQPRSEPPLAKKGDPSQELPITLPWRRVGNFALMAGVWQRAARRKLCVNMGGKRCQWSERSGVRNYVGKWKDVCHMNGLKNWH